MIMHDNIAHVIVHFKCHIDKPRIAERSAHWPHCVHTLYPQNTEGYSRRAGTLIAVPPIRAKQAAKVPRAHGVNANQMPVSGKGAVRLATHHPPRPNPGDEATATGSSKVAQTDPAHRTRKSLYIVRSVGNVLLRPCTVLRDKSSGTDCHSTPSRGYAFFIWMQGQTKTFHLTLRWTCEILRGHFRMLFFRDRGVWRWSFGSSGNSGK